MARAKLIRANYDRARCRIGVVHVGVGAFHRAHQAVYFDRLLERGDHRWGIAGVNLRRAQSDPVRALKKRGNRYVLKTMSGAGVVEWREVQSLCAVHDWCEAPGEAEALLADPRVELVTMTVTESGYYNNEYGRLDLAHPAFTGTDRGQITLFEYLRRGLNLRRGGGGGPITLLCCDNLRRNGALLQRCLADYLRATDEHELLAWLGSHASFPSCMVDRITPRPEPQLAGEVASLFGVADDATVMAEDYLQWVVEDDFAGARPPLAQAGAQMVADVLPYEEAKIRILNGGHTALVYFAALRGFERFDEAMRDAALGDFFERFEREEALPALAHETPAQADGLPVDYAAYLDIIRDRFGNRHIKDAVARIAMDGASKFPLFILPTVRGCFGMGHPPRRSVQAIAAWYAFMRAVRAGRIGFAYVEPKWDALSPLLDASCAEEFAASEMLWGDVPRRYPAFREMLLREIRAGGGDVSGDVSTERVTRLPHKPTDD